MDETKKMHCRANGEVILEVRNLPQPSFSKKAFIKMAQLLTTTVKGKPYAQRTDL